MRGKSSSCTIPATRSPSPVPGCSPRPTAPCSTRSPVDDATGCLRRPPAAGPRTPGSPRRSGATVRTFPGAALERHEGAVVDRRGASWDHQQSRDDWSPPPKRPTSSGCRGGASSGWLEAPGGLDAIRVGRTYLLRSAPVLALAKERRDRDRRTEGLPETWRPRRHRSAKPAPAPDVIEALMLAIDSYIASLPSPEFDQLAGKDTAMRTNPN